MVVIIEKTLSKYYTYFDTIFIQHLLFTLALLFQKKNTQNFVEKKLTNQERGS
jgi:hypothetical protein